MDPLTIAAALLPIATDGIRGLIGKFTNGAGVKPLNVEEAIKLQDADTKRLEALAKMDTPSENISQWVSDVRAMQRPTVVIIVLLAYLYMIVAPVSPQTEQLVTSLTSAVVFYLFGDRTLAQLKRSN